MTATLPPSSRPTKSKLNLSLGILTPFIMLFVTGIFTVAAVIAYGLDMDALTKAITALLIVTILGEIATLALLTGIAKTPQGWRSFLGLENFSWKGVWVGAGVGIGFLILLQIFSILASTLGTEVGNSETSDMLGDASGPGKYFVLALAVPILAPIMEELIFRGFCLSAIITGAGGSMDNLRGKITWAGIVTSSAFFAMLHFQGFGSVTDFIVLGITFTLGMGHAILRLKFRSITPAIASHMAYNGVTALIIAFV